jgi:hypothetical protein
MPKLTCADCERAGLTRSIPFFRSATRFCPVLGTSDDDSPCRYTAAQIRATLAELSAGPAFMRQYMPRLKAVLALMEVAPDAH